MPDVEITEDIRHAACLIDPFALNLEMEGWSRCPPTCWISCHRIRKCLFLTFDKIISNLLLAAANLSQTKTPRYCQIGL